MWHSTRCIVNLKDVYDDNELKNHNPGITFLKDIDRKTGYRTKQMLVAPIIDADSGELMGVIQLINALTGQPFPAAAEEGLQELAKTLAIAFRQRTAHSQPRFDYPDQPGHPVPRPKSNWLPAPRTAKGKDVEEILIDEFQVKLTDLGQSLADFYHIPYEPFKADRIKPDDLLKNLKRDYVEGSLWVPIDDTPEGMVILTPEPDRIMGSTRGQQHLSQTQTDLQGLHPARIFRDPEPFLRRSRQPRFD